MKVENLSYKEMVKVIKENVEDNYNLEVCFESEYGDHMACEGSNIPYTFKFDGKEFEIIGKSKILNEDTDDEEIITKYSVEF